MNTLDIKYIVITWTKEKSFNRPEKDINVITRRLHWYITIK